MKIIQPKGTLNELGYKERVENYIDYAEQRFEEYCKTKSFHYKKLLFNDDADFGNSPIPYFHKLGILSALPDYFVYSKENSQQRKSQFFVEVKASNKLKLKDLKKYITFAQMFCDSRYTQYTICFAFKDGLKFKSVDQILKLLPQSKIQTWNDGIEYYLLPI
jgi:hypothetical protein